MSRHFRAGATLALPGQGGTIAVQGGCRHDRDIAQPSRETLARIQADATAANGWMVIESTEGRTFLLAGSMVICHAAAAEFVDDDGERVVLPYGQIASAEIGRD
jgi:hypothetical protein